MKSTRRGFTLLEMLTVMVIMSILLVMGASMANNVLGAYRLAIAADSLNGGLESARLLATAKNRKTEFRLIRPDGKDWRYFQVLVANDTGSGYTPYTGVSTLPEGIELRDDTTYGGLTTLPLQTINGGRYDGASYAAIRFDPEGKVVKVTETGTTDTLADTENFLTLVATTTGADLPANWVALNVDTKTGVATRFQP